MKNIAKYPGGGFFAKLAHVFEITALVEKKHLIDVSNVCELLPGVLSVCLERCSRSVQADTRIKI
jgi:hypothetical protein